MTRRLAFTLGFGLLVGVACACGGSPQPKPLGNQNAMVVKRDDLSLLPVDAELVFGVNVAQVQQSTLWQKLVAPKFGEGEVGRALSKLKELCNIDVMSEARTVVAGVKHVLANVPEAWFVVHGLGRDKVAACLANPTVVAELAKQRMEVRRDGEVTVLHETGTLDGLALQFLDGDTLFGVISKNPSPDLTATLAAGHVSLKASSAFVALYEKLDHGASLWGLANGNTDLLARLAELGARPKAVFGTLNVTDRLVADVRLRLETPDLATQFAASMKQSMAMLGAFVDHIDVTSDSTDVRFDVAVSEQKLVGISQMRGF